MAHFFDDSGIVDFESARGTAQTFVRAVYALAGADLDPAKSQSPACSRTFLGLNINLSSAVDASLVAIDLKTEFRLSVQADIDSILSSGTLSSGQAAKLRGKFGWAASGTYGRCAQGGQATSTILISSLKL